jgi:glycosyltransferase involved in cell wall biosynthesis
VASHFIEQLHSNCEVHLCLIHDEEIFFDLPTHVNIHILNKKKIILSFFKLIKLINHIQPDSIISSLAHLNMMVLMSRPFISKKINIFIREGSVVQENLKAEPHPTIMAFLYKHLYKKADKIICQSNFMILELNTLFNIPKEKCICIYNPVQFEISKKLTKSNQNSEVYPKLISIGRLDAVKQFHLVIEKIPDWIKKYPNLHYTIIGDGPERNHLEELIEAKNLSKYVSILGYIKNTQPYLMNSDCFILSSKYEGLPNALLEAFTYKIGLLVLNHKGGIIEVMEECKLSHLICDELNLEEKNLKTLSDENYQKLEEVLSIKHSTKKLMQLIDA